MSVLSCLHAVAGRLAAEVAFYRCLIAHPDTPKVARFLLGAAIAYALSPIDLIPDWIPILGQLDDLIIVPLLVVCALKLTDEDVVAQCRAEALRES